MDLFGQFALKILFQFTLFGININITNGTVSMFIIMLLIFVLFYFGTLKLTNIPNKFQAFIELIFDFTINICKENLGEKHYLKYTPFLTSIFIFVLLSNLLGMVPFIGFTVTSHVSVCLALALIIWLYSIALGFYLHGLRFFNLFAPKGLPTYIIPLVFIIELISFIFRPITLTARLVANMMAGHILLKVFSYMVLMLFSSYFIIFCFMPFLFMLILVPLELFVACIQAYIFFLLSVFYIKDAIHLH